jgi:hypothetical protein
MPSEEFAKISLPRLGVAVLSPPIDRFVRLAPAAAR